MDVPFRATLERADLCPSAGGPLSGEYEKRQMIPSCIIASRRYNFSFKVGIAVNEAAPLKWIL
jgi:hypothetical protein